MTQAVVEKARELAAGGQHSAVIEYLSACTGRELADSPSLSLIYGTAQARLGRHQEALPWIELALEQARRGAERALERQALNVRGAIALVSGKIDEAADSFTQALLAASRDGDHATTGRCSNNLGIISNLRGRHAEAIGSWEIAAAAFDRAGLRQGVAECYHNVGIALREQGTLDEALDTAARAIREAEASGDHSLWAVTLRGRAEIHVAKGDLGQARRELTRVREIRGRVRDPIGEAEDLRVAASLLVAEGDLSAADLMLREVIGRAEPTGRAHLLAEATRDLALVLRRVGRTADAQAAARTAKAIFTRLGAEGEIRALAGQDWDPAFAIELHGSIAPLHMAQQLADAGHYAQLLTYLGERSQDELEQSPMLTLLCGIAHSRLGRLDLGQHWAVVAQLRARVLRDRPLEVRALNVCGAIALDRGGIDEAVYFFTRAQEEASRDNDLATVGRCSNNLGIIANMRGDYERAAAAYLRAITAYQQAGYGRGVAESRHNLAIAYRSQGALDRALEVAEQAVRDAAELGDRQLEAQAVAGLAEIHVYRGRLEQAVREVGSALDVHRALKDVVREAEDKRILALALARADQAPEAEALLREVMACATEHKRSWLVATAQRDLAQLLMGQGKVADATAEAQEAHAIFERLGAWGEMEQLDALLKPAQDSNARVA